MAVLKKPSCALGSKNVFFIHNWRCAGSSMHSLLSSNFGENYFKIGTQFSDFGWPLYDKPEKLTLEDLRIEIRKGGILSGHLCSGVESLFAGEWDLWVNARKPVERLSSGILRFHSKSFQMSSGTYPIEEVRLQSEKVLDNLMNTELKHEQNGISLRMAGFAVANSLSIQSTSNLERLSRIHYSGSPEALFSAALEKVHNAKIVIIPQYLHAALICIEKIYHLSPLINLFSDLRHNSVAFGGASEAERKVFELSKPLIKNYCSEDLKLWEELARKFQMQLDSCHVSKRAVAVRNALHSCASPILDPVVFNQTKDNNYLISLCVAGIVRAAKGNLELSEDIVDLAGSWSRFDPDASKEIRDRALHNLRN